MTNRVGGGGIVHTWPISTQNFSCVWSIDDFCFTQNCNFFVTEYFHKLCGRNGWCMSHVARQLLGRRTFLGLMTLKNLFSSRKWPPPGFGFKMILFETFPRKNVENGKVFCQKIQCFFAPQTRKNWFWDENKCFLNASTPFWPETHASREKKWSKIKENVRRRKIIDLECPPTMFYLSTNCLCSPSWRPCFGQVWSFCTVSAFFKPFLGDILGMFWLKLFFSKYQNQKENSPKRKKQMEMSGDLNESPWKALSNHILFSAQLPAQPKKRSIETPWKPCRSRPF